MAVTPHKKYAAQGGEYTRGFNFMKPGLGGHRGRRGPQTTDTTKARPDFPDSPQQESFFFAGNPNTMFVGANNIDTGYCPDEEEQLSDPHGLQRRTEQTVAGSLNPFIYLPECGDNQTIDEFGNRHIDRCCDDNKLGPCKYKFIINPQKAFKDVEYGKRINLTSVRKHIIASAIKKGFTRPSDGKYIHYVYKVPGEADDCPYSKSLIDSARFICETCKELLPIGWGQLYPKKTCWGTGVTNINNWIWPEGTQGWDETKWDWYPDSKLDKCLKCLVEKMYTPENFPSEFVRTPCYPGQGLFSPAETPVVDAKTDDVLDGPLGVWGHPPNFNPDPATAGVGLLGKVNIVVREKYGCDQDRFYYVKITDVAHQEAEPSIDLKEAVLISYCWARNKDLTLKSPCKEGILGKVEDLPKLDDELEWSQTQYVTITDPDMLTKPCYYEVHLECSDERLEGPDPETGWYPCHGDPASMIPDGLGGFKPGPTGENAAQPPPSYRDPKKPCNGVKLLFYGPFSWWVTGFPVTPDSLGAGCEEDSNHLYGPWWVRAKRLGDWVSDSNNGRRCECLDRFHPTRLCNVCACPVSKWGTDGKVACAICYKSCCRFKGFPQFAPSNGWDTARLLHGKIKKMACTCWSSDALANDCGCDDDEPPEKLSSFSAKEMVMMNKIILNWSFPKRKAGEYVFIQWKVTGFPDGPDDGTTIQPEDFEEKYTHGTGNVGDLFTDQNYYYTAFTVDAEGNINPDGLQATAKTDPPPE